MERSPFNHEDELNEAERRRRKRWRLLLTTGRWREGRPSLTERVVVRPLVTMGRGALRMVGLYTGEKTLGERGVVGRVQRASRAVLGLVMGTEARAQAEQLPGQQAAAKREELQSLQAVGQALQTQTERLDRTTHYSAGATAASEDLPLPGTAQARLEAGGGQSGPLGAEDQLPQAGEAQSAEQPVGAYTIQSNLKSEAVGPEVQQEVSYGPSESVGASGPVQAERNWQSTADRGVEVAEDALPATTETATETTPLSVVVGSALMGNIIRRPQAEDRNTGAESTPATMALPWEGATLRPDWRSQALQKISHQQIALDAERRALAAQEAPSVAGVVALAGAQAEVARQTADVLQVSPEQVFVGSAALPGERPAPTPGELLTRQWAAELAQHEQTRAPTEQELSDRIERQPGRVSPAMLGGGALSQSPHGQSVRADVSNVPTGGSAKKPMLVSRPPMIGARHKRAAHSDTTWWLVGIVSAVTIGGFLYAVL